MTLQLYLGVEGVLLRRTGPTATGETGFELMPCAMEFLEWAALEFECHWLTRLNRDNEFGQIERAFKAALGIPETSYELDLLFELVQTSCWEDSKIEAIDLHSNFRWIDDDPGQNSMAVLERLGLTDRLIICREPGDLFRKTYPLRS